MKRLTKLTNFFVMPAIIASLLGCASIEPRLATRVAQPDNRPVRNFTSFSTALRCMDEKLAAAGTRRVLVSSTGIPDLSRKIYVGADEMLINALNHMNRQSGAYVFVDQALEKDAGQLAILTTRGEDDERFPRLYFRGAITQVDTNVVSDSGSLSLDLSSVLSPPKILGGNLGQTDQSASRGVSVVSVDLHLVGYPSRQVLPGGSVANSMVVVSDGSGFSGEGEIKLAGVELTLNISRVESVGQAVRNLVELGTIELIGRHSGLPYWDCLSLRPSNEKATNGAWLAYNSLTEIDKYTRIQKMLTHLGYYNGPITTWLDPETRAAISAFQASQKLIATGAVNFDLYERLQERTKGFQVENVRPLRSYATSPPDPIGSAKAAKETGIKVTNSSNKLTLSSSQTRYRVGDVLTATLTVRDKGYVSCFQQTGTGAITQILPVNPTDRIAVSTARQMSVPASNANFDIRIESKSRPEKIMCLLDRAKSPATSAFGLGAKGPLEPTTSTSFESVIKAYAKFGKRVPWTTLTVAAK
jgi:peptidoglycan hydrolase-like protein with peptidoglycan-binding domain